MEKWHIGLSSSQALTVGLYIRDRLGISSRPDVPPVEPTVECVIVAKEVEAVSEEWARWWSAATTERLDMATSGAPFLSEMPLDAELRELTVPVYGDALRWAASRKADVAHRAMAYIEAKHDRQLIESALAASEKRGLRLRLVIVPVVGQWTMLAPNGTWLISFPLWSDQPSYAEFLQSRVTDFLSGA